MSEFAGVEIAPWEDGDEPAICRLFERTFGRPKSVARWRWQFLGSGFEPPVMIARDAGGEVLAHFGGVPLRAQVAGQPACFVVAVDNMVAPERRAGLQRRGLFAEVVTRWVEHFCTGGPVVFGYGLGNDQVTRIGQRFLGFEDIPGQTLLARRLTGEPGHGGPAPAPGAAPGAERGAEVGAGKLPPSDHDALWERCAARRADGPLRDARFLRWRFAEAPGERYEFLGVRRGGRLTVSAVWKAGYVVPDSATLVELLWDGEEPGDLALAIREAETRALARGLHHLAMLLPDSAPEAAVAEALGYGRVRSGLHLVGRSFREELAFDDVAGRLRYAFSDFDLV